MKTNPTLIVLLCLLLSFLPSKSQDYRYIPDPNFRAYLVSIACPFDTSGDSLDISSSVVINTTNISCTSLSINSIEGIQYFNNLVVLSCGNNNLTSLPTLPSTLTTLYCLRNSITSLPVLPSSLSYLDCSINSITSLPILPSTLIYLNCSDNLISSLPSLPSSLISLYCGINILTSLPTLPPNLSDLSCNNNHIAVLPTLPINITSLVCANNNISSLPTLPVSLLFLYCQYNQLSSLPTLPNYIIELDCSNNLLNSLPVLSDSLNYFYCRYNSISSLPILPDKLVELNISNNPIYCLPYLPQYISSLNYDSTLISCLPNFPSMLIDLTPTFGTHPLCNPYVHSCPSYVAIDGFSYLDTDHDCIIDTSETRISNISIFLNRGTSIIQHTNTYYNGLYAFDTFTNDVYTTHIDTTDIPFMVSCPISGYDTITIDSSHLFYSDRNFALQCKPGFDLGSTGLLSTSSIRPATTTTFDLHAGDMAGLYGVHCTGISGKISLNYTGLIHYSSVRVGTLIPDTILPNRLVWNIADFSLLDFNNDIKPIFFVDSSAIAGDLICFTTEVTPTIGDRVPSNNTFSQCFVVRASYDPNIKEVSPSGTITADQDWLYYTIHFQNTGNSYAENIYVWDTIDTHLDINSIQVMGASHNQFMNVFNSNRSVRFNFLNIMLEDSPTNEPASHGWVQYRIKPYAGLSEGLQIHNTAYILFDLNAPVVTNTVTNRICNTPSTITQSYIIENGESVRVGTHTYTSSGLYTDILNNVNACDSIIHTTVQVVGGMISNQIMRMIMYPNPANHQVLIQLEGYPTEPLNIFDMYGRKVFESESISNKFLVNTESWHAGTYIIQCGNKREKLVVNH